MSDSLKDQLLGLGFKPAPKPERNERNPDAKPGTRPAGGERPRGGKPRTQEEIDLAKAYALRAETEKRERMAAEQAKQEAARVRREAKAIFPDAIALEVDPNAPPGSDEYADPQYRVPDDLVW